MAKIEKVDKLAESEQQLVSDWWQENSVSLYGEEVVATAKSKDQYEQNFVFKAVEDGQLVGISSGKCSLGLGYIHELVINEKWRGKGIGSVLLAKAEEFCRERGARRLALRTDSNGAAVDFYCRRGWTIEHESKDWFGGHTFLQMRKDLDLDL